MTKSHKRRALRRRQVLEAKAASDARTKPEPPRSWHQDGVDGWKDFGGGVFMTAPICTEQILTLTVQSNGIAEES